MYLILTILCACIFLGVKYFEYSHKFEEGLLPPRWYHAQPTDTVRDVAGNVSHGYATFFAFYFMMTGLHGIHILVGIVLLAWIAVRANRGEFTKAYYTPVDLVGLYWHLVDLDLDLSVPAVLPDQMSTHTEHTHDHHAHSHPEDGAGVYVKTLIALLILTVITVGASYIDFGSGNIVIALFIATIKASWSRCSSCTCAMKSR